MSITTCILTVPPYSHIDIHTDSANCIDTFFDYINTLAFKCLNGSKENNFLIWKLFVLIEDKDLFVKC